LSSSFSLRRWLSRSSGGPPAGGGGAYPAGAPAISAIFFVHVHWRVLCVAGLLPPLWNLHGPSSIDSMVYWGLGGRSSDFCLRLPPAAGSSCTAATCLEPYWLSSWSSFLLSWRLSCRLELWLFPSGWRRSTATSTMICPGRPPPDGSFHGRVGGGVLVRDGHGLCHGGRLHPAKLVLEHSAISAAVAEKVDRLVLAHPLAGVVHARPPGDVGAVRFIRPLHAKSELAG